MKGGCIYKFLCEDDMKNNFTLHQKRVLFAIIFGLIDLIMFNVLIFSGDLISNYAFLFFFLQPVYILLVVLAILHMK